MGHGGGLPSAGMKVSRRDVLIGAGASGVTAALPAWSAAHRDSSSSASIWGFTSGSACEAPLAGAQLGPGAPLEAIARSRPVEIGTPAVRFNPETKGWRVSFDLSRVGKNCAN